MAGARTLSLRFLDPASKQTDLAVTVPIGPLPTSPRTWLVPGDAPTIQAAIDLARPGDSVLVVRGTYAESLNFGGKDIVLKSSAGADRTVLQGYGRQLVLEFDTGESRDAVLDGFTIQGGYGNNGGFRGGGIDVLFSSPTISHDVVQNNSAILGGGIGVYGGSPAIVDNLITGNVALTFGGGVFMSSTAAAVISGNRIERNNWPKYGLDGGGAAIDGQDLLFQDNVITQNGIWGSSNGEGAAGLVDLALDGHARRGQPRSGQRRPRRRRDRRRLPVPVVPGHRPDGGRQGRHRTLSR